MTRQYFVWLHRWIGLIIALFLVIVGLTGSLLAFKTNLEKWISPQLFAGRPTSDAKHLDLATLAKRAEAAEPHARVEYFSVGPEQVFMHVAPRIDPTLGKPYKLDFNQMFLDPWTGHELGHRMEGDLSQGLINLMPFINELHESLVLGTTGRWVLGLVALAWTLNCFVAFYLTFPVLLSRFLYRWKSAWKIKWSSSVFRLNFDLHRASGLWLWPLLFIFAWSSVMFNLSPVYEWTTAKVLDYDMEFPPKTLEPTHENDTPRLGWTEALKRAEKLIDEAGKEKGFSVIRPFGFAYIPEEGAYSYHVVSTRNISYAGWETGVWIDGDTGALLKIFLPNGEHGGNTITTWLRALHFADIYDILVYRIFVCVLGVVITMFPITGIYIWLKKRRARRIAKERHLRVEKRTQD